MRLETNGASPRSAAEGGMRQLSGSLLNLPCTPLRGEPVGRDGFSLGGRY